MITGKTPNFIFPRLALVAKLCRFSDKLPDFGRILPKISNMSRIRVDPYFQIVLCLLRELGFVFDENFLQISALKGVFWLFKRVFFRETSCHSQMMLLFFIQNVQKSDALLLFWVRDEFFDLLLSFSVLKL